MKKIIAFAAAPALVMTAAACGGNEVDDPAEADIAKVDAGAADHTAQVAGTYSGNTEDGGTWTSVLNEDGTFEDTENGEVVRTGSWTHDPVEGTCFTTTGDTEAQCFMMGEPAADGTVEVTGPDGSTFTMNKVS